MSTDLQSDGGIWLHDLSHVLDKLRDTGSYFSGTYPNHHALWVAFFRLIHGLLVRHGLLPATAGTTRHCDRKNSVSRA